jgi:CheY-like chemotaxis protein
MKFPLYHRPSALVFLDDETPYLEMLAMVLPGDWCIRFHTRKDDFLAQAQAQTLLWEEDIALHQEIFNKWYQGEPLPALILEYWRNEGQRYDLPNTAVVDYAMPAATGLDVLKDCALWPKHRVLLTGKADEHIAVAAFNDGLIDRFVTKQRPELVQHLISVLRQLQQAPLDTHESIWRNALRRSQQQALQDRVVQQSLNEWLKAKHCVEYVVIPEPFGVLALDASAHVHWLQFEMHKDLAVAVDLAGAAGQSSDVLAAIAKGEVLSDAEWLQSIGSTAPPQAAPAFAWGTGGYLLAAHFPQPELGVVGVSHRAFLAGLSARTVDEE